MNTTDRVSSVRDLDFDFLEIGMGLRIEVGIGVGFGAAPNDGLDQTTHLT